MFLQPTSSVSIHKVNQIPDSCSGLRQYFINMSQNERSKNFADTSGIVEMTGLSRQTIVNWIREGKILAFRMGRKKYIILKTSVTDYLKKCEEHQEIEGIIRKAKVKR